MFRFVGMKRFVGIKRHGRGYHFRLARDAFFCSEAHVIQNDGVADDELVCDVPENL